MAKKYTPALQVKVTILRVEPTAGQLVSYKRLWTILLAGTASGRTPRGAG
jgi:hypothetical protein